MVFDKLRFYNYLRHCIFSLTIYILCITVNPYVFYSAFTISFLFVCGIMQYMTKKQRENFSKLLYDMVKLTYTGLIIGGIISPKGLLWFHIVFGVFVSILFLIVGYILDKKE